MSDDLGAPPPLPGSGPTPAGPPPPLPGSGPTPAPSVEPPHDHALRHESQATRTYPCGTCGGELHFDIGEQRLKCPHCGNIQDLTEATGAVEERDLQSALAQLRSSAGQAQALVAGEKEVVCQNCGGHTTFTGTLTSTLCPYCVTPIQRDDIHDAPARIAVDGVLPFKVDDRQAKAQLEEWINGRWFAPSEFKQYSRAGSFASVYTAYFTYDAEATTRYTGKRGTNHTVTTGSGENRETRTEIRWRNVSGTVHDTFDDVAIAANDGLDKSHVESLEPWPLDQVQPFSPEYVAGHLSRTYDHDVEECFTTAKDRMERTITTTIERDIGGDHQRISSRSTTWTGLTFKHVLLPIWLLTVTYEGKPFQVMINGVTGEVQGQRPYSKVKIAFAVLIALIVIGVVAYLYAGR